MKPAEHYTEAERMLAEASNISVVMEVGRDIPIDQADRLRGFLQERGVENPLVAHGVRIDVTPLLLAAQVHATLAGCQLRSLTAEEQA